MEEGVLARESIERAGAADAEIPWPIIDLNGDDPVSEITASAEFAACGHFFSSIEAAERALMSPVSQALLFCLIRNLQPKHVVEIGTYRASTSEAICRALHANGYGLLHTVDPFAGQSVLPVLDRWPAGLREHVRFYPMNSMGFFGQAVRAGRRPGIVFVDGDHAYEFAAFDIECAARLIEPGGFILVDNISQPGPYFAMVDFLKNHPDWRELGESTRLYRPELPFDRRRTTVTNTDFGILRAPKVISVGTRPYTPGEQVWSDPQLGGVSLSVAAAASGTLNLQYVLRIFAPRPIETTVEKRVELVNQVGLRHIPFEVTFEPEHVAFTRRVEVWLTWTGETLLRLNEPPALFASHPAAVPNDQPRLSPQPPAPPPAGLDGGFDDIDKWLKSVDDRLYDPDLDPTEISRLGRAYAQAYPGRQFPLHIEARSLEMFLVREPNREDLRSRLSDVRAQLRGLMKDVGGCSVSPRKE